MKEIPLTRGLVSIVDDEDFHRFGQLKWYALPARTSPTHYACRKTRTEGHVSLHRLILDAPAGMVVDHIDGDGLNNRRSNLRLATRRQNQFNRVGRRNASSRFKGVYWNKATQSWVVRVGGFASEEEAGRAFDMIARFAHGEFARLNFPEDGEQAA